MERRTALAALAALLAGCTSSCERAVEPTGPVEPADEVACVEKRGDGVSVRMAGVDETQYVRTTVRPMRDPDLSPVELTHAQIVDFPVLRTGLAYFSYDYDATVVRSTHDQLRFQSWLDSYWKERRDADAVLQKRPFRVDDAMFAVGVAWYS